MRLDDEEGHRVEVAAAAFAAVLMSAIAHATAKIPEHVVASGAHFDRLERHDPERCVAALDKGGAHGCFHGRQGRLEPPSASANLNASS